jgi:hypothetical protein
MAVVVWETGCRWIQPEWCTIDCGKVGTTLDDETDVLRRVKFFSPEDLSAGWFVGRVVELVEQFDEEHPPGTVADVLELHNVLQFLVHEMLPNDYSAAQREAAKARIPKIRGVVARYFSQVDESTLASRIDGVEFDGHDDLLKLLGQGKVFERCSAAVVLRALADGGFHLRQLLGCERLVATYDVEIRRMLGNAATRRPRGSSNRTPASRQGSRSACRGRRSSRSSSRWTVRTMLKG